jgi:hypothetical protein
MIGATIMTCSHHLSPRPSGGQRLHPLRSCDEGGIGNQTPGLTPGDHCWGWGSKLRGFPGLELEHIPRRYWNLGFPQGFGGILHFTFDSTNIMRSLDQVGNLVTLGPVLRPGVQGLQETHGEMPTWMSCHLSDGS